MTGNTDDNWTRWAQQASDRITDPVWGDPVEPPEDWDYNDPEPAEEVEGVPVDVWMRLGVRGL